MRRFLYSLAVAGTALLVSTSPVAVSADAGAAAAAANAGISATLKSLDYRYFVAGGVCAATSHGITCPIDVVKTKIQAQPEVSVPARVDNKTFVVVCLPSFARSVINL